MWRVLMVVLVLVVVLVACSPPPPRRAPTFVAWQPTADVLDATRPPSGPHRPFVPRPALASVSATLAELRDLLAPDLLWPLSRRPSLEPSYPLTLAFRGAQGAWPDLCASRGPLRKHDALDIITYLEAWCRLRAEGVDAALGDLAKLRVSGEVGAAAREDLVVLLAEGHEAGPAMRSLRAHRAETVEALDGLMTAYLVLDRVADANAVSERILSRDPRPALATRCRRLRRELPVASLPQQRDEIHRELAALADRDPICATVQHHLGCPLLTDRANVASQSERDANVSIIGVAIQISAVACKRALGPGAPSEAQLLVAAAWSAWPADGGHFGVWWEIALRSNQARPESGADTLMVAALENAVASSRCEPTRLGQIRLLAAAVRSAPDHPAELAGALDVLADVEPGTCVGR